MFRKPNLKFRSQRQTIDSDEEDQKESSQYNGAGTNLSLLENCEETDEEIRQWKETQNLISKFNDTKLDKKKKRNNKHDTKKECATMKTSQRESILNFVPKPEEDLEAIVVSPEVELALGVEYEGKQDYIDEHEEMQNRLEKLLLVEPTSNETEIKPLIKKHEIMRLDKNLSKNQPYTLSASSTGSVDGLKKLRSAQKGSEIYSDGCISKTSFIKKSSTSQPKNLLLKENAIIHSSNLSNEKTHEPYNEDEIYWEAQQIRKAITARQLENSVGSTTIRLMGVSLNPYHDGLQSQRYDIQKHGPSNTCSPIFATEGNLDESFNTVIQNTMLTPKEQIVYTVKQIKERMVDRLHFLRDMTSENKVRLHQAHVDLSYNHKEIVQFDINIPGMANKRKYYQGLRWYITNLLECYNEKLPSIKSVEDKINQYRGDATKKRIGRRRQNVTEKSKELRLSLKTSPLMNALEKVEEASPQNITTELEERRRLEIKKSKSNQTFFNDIKDVDGLSSDEDTSIINQSTIKTEAREIMSDVREEFSSLECICEKLEEWNEIDKVAFKNEVRSICLPKIFAPLIRLQILFWNPLTERKNIESMEWYKTIEQFANKTRIATKALLIHKSEKTMIEDHAVYENTKPDHLVRLLKGDPARSLLSFVVDTVLVERVLNVVHFSYDPLSTTQTLNLVCLLKMLIQPQHSTNPESFQLNDILKVVREKLKDVIENDLFIPIGYPKALLKNPLSEHAVFFERQFWKAYKLYFNVLSWHGILSDDFISELSFNSILNRYLVIALGVMVSCGQYMEVCRKCSHIIEALPVSWITIQTALGAESLTTSSRPYINKLQNFSDFLVRTFGAESRCIPTKYIVDITSLIRKIGSEDEIQTMERKLYELTQ